MTPYRMGLMDGFVGGCVFMFSLFLIVAMVAGLMP